MTERHIFHKLHFIFLLLHINLVSQIAAKSCKVCEAPLRNWAGNVQFKTNKILFPQNNEEVVDIVKNCRGKIRVIGSRHSFSQIANTDGTLVSLEGMTRVVGYDLSIPSISVQAGLTYSDLVTLLDSHGYALPNLSAFSGITIGGAAATGVHGTGINNTNLADSIIGMTFVLANGTIVRWTRVKHSEFMKAAVVSLGVLGVVTELTLKLVPAYQMETHVFQGMNMSTFLANIDQILNDAYAVNVFNNFAHPEHIFQVWLRSKLGDAGYKNFSGATEYYGASRVSELDHGPLTQAPGRVSPLGKVDSWYRHLLYNGLDHGGFNGAGFDSEYFIPLSAGAAAIKTLLPLATEIGSVSVGQDFRVVAPDTAWMSTANGDNSAKGERLMTIDFSWPPNEQEALPIMRKIEHVLAPFKPRPHWGKRFEMEASTYLPLYDQLDAFIRIANELDPRGKFRNSFVEEKLFAKL